MKNKYVVSTRLMTAIDEITIKDYGINGFTLMESAGKSVFHEIEDRIDSEKKIAVISGMGNNGGDGFVITRYLFNNHYNVVLYLCADPVELKGESAKHFQLLLKTGFKEYRVLSDVVKSFDKYDFIIDAIFGTGFNRKAGPFYRKVFDKVNKSGAIIISVDSPSGLNGDSGESEGVKADHTISIGSYKHGHLINNGPDYTGNLSLIDIGFPESVYKSLNIKSFFVEKDLIRAIFPKRKQLSYKHKFGKVLVVGAKSTMAGAATMTALAALKSGSGLVKVINSKESGIDIINNNPEIMVNPVFSENDITLTKAAKETLIELCNWSDIICYGMGVDDSPIYKEIYKVLIQSSKKIVLDAGAIQFLKLFRSKTLPEIIITPHLGEFNKLIEKNISESTLEHLSEVLKDYSVHCLLKGKTSIISFLDGRRYFDTGGNSALATAGSGDILAGLIAGFYAQKKSLAEATLIANYLHGRSAEIGSKKISEYCFTATDILRFLPEGIKELMNE